MMNDMGANANRRQACFGCLFVQRTRRDSRACRAAQFAGMEFSHYRSRANDL